MRLLKSRVYNLAELIKEMEEKKKTMPEKEAHTGICSEKRGLAGNIGRDVQASIGLK